MDFVKIKKYNVPDNVVESVKELHNMYIFFRNFYYGELLELKPILLKYIRHNYKKTIKYIGHNYKKTIKFLHSFINPHILKCYYKYVDIFHNTYNDYIKNNILMDVFMDVKYFKDVKFEILKLLKDPKILKILEEYF